MPSTSSRAPRFSSSSASSNAVCRSPTGRRTRRRTSAPTWTRETFEAGVRTIKERIAAGDIYQAVLSQRFEAEVTADPLHRLPRAPPRQPVAVHVFHPHGRTRHRRLVAGDAGARRRPARRDPSDRRHAAARPERRGRPAARRRAEAQREGARRARHARGSRAQRSRPGLRVRLGQGAAIHGRSSATRTSCTWSRPSKAGSPTDRDHLDALVACFPAGTVSGAPKIRAMQILPELEPTRRDLYAGRRRLHRLRRQPRFLHRDSHHHHPRRRARGSRPAPASSPTRTPRPSTKKPATRPARSCRPSRWRRQVCSGPSDRQLRLVHVQPRPVSRRAGCAAAGAAQRRDLARRGRRDEARSRSSSRPDPDGPRMPASRST